MSCAGRTRANAADAPGMAAGRRVSTLAARIGSLIAKGWCAYWNWRLKRTTVLIVQSLDRRTLHDIGIDPSEIESLIYDRERERRQRRNGT